MKLTGKVISIGRHERDGEAIDGVLIEVPREQLQQGGILYREVQIETVEPKPAIGAAEPEQTLCGVGNAPLNSVGKMLLRDWMTKHANQYKPGGWDYDKEGAALVEATAVFLDEKDPWGGAR